MKYIDIVEIKSAIAKGKLIVFVEGNFIYMKDAKSGECVKIGELKNE